MTTRGGKQAGKGRAMSFRKVSYFILDISESFFMQLNVSRRLHDDFAPARRPTMEVKSVETFPVILLKLAIPRLPPQTKLDLEQNG